MKEIHYVKASNVPTGTAVVEQIKLHTVNVIEITNGSDIQSVRSFADNPAGNRAAERLFKRCIKENASVKYSKADIESYLDDGIWEIVNYQILITHST